MKSTRKSIIILLIIIALAIQANAQNDPGLTTTTPVKKFPTIAFSLVPLYTFQNGFRVDFEFHLTKNQWILIGPQYFIAQNKSMDMFLGTSRSMNLEGYGIDIYHKVLLKNEQTIKGPYFAYGIRYNSFNFTADAEFSSPKIDVTNTRYGFNVLFGYQHAINDKLLIDLYTGCGIQVSNLSPDDDNLNDDNEFFLNYNYSGPRFLLGFRIGLFLN